MPCGTGFNIVLSALRRRLSRRGIVSQRNRHVAVLNAMAQFTLRGNALEDRPVGLLSGGNQQKVMLARACSDGPLLLLLDQPTVGVDSAAKLDIHAHIRRLANAGVTCLLVSDDLDELRTLTHSIAVMHNGAIQHKTYTASLSASDLLALMSQRRSDLCDPLWG